MKKIKELDQHFALIPFCNLQGVIEPEKPREIIPIITCNPNETI